MGLDVVELVMRTEEVFGITIPDEDAEQATTVGKLYEIVCARLELPPAHARPTGSAIPAAQRIDTPRTTPDLDRSADPAATGPREKVWATLVSIVVDQLAVDASEVRYDARFGNDLGAD